MHKILDLAATALSMTPQMKLVEPNFERYTGDDMERSWLAWIVYALAQSALGEMSELLRVTLSHLLMMMSTGLSTGLLLFLGGQGGK
jgi:uncharacterized membrane protein